jgi:hypothetical protein
VAQSSGSQEGIAVRPNPFVHETLQLCPFLRNQSRIGVETVERIVSKSTVDLRRSLGEGRKGSLGRKWEPKLVLLFAGIVGAQEQKNELLASWQFSAVEILSQIIGRRAVSEGNCWTERRFCCDS